ncbi:unnamed protein product [Symbiodinium natans]|uniref:Uncharacterized protein n=1 Tax=Symbiodinium natans TaxID=878477 RepID=A0A812T2F5_9DINO|nr:unnamed protein product [Symbiodinium natans]
MRQAKVAPCTQLSNLGQEKPEEEPNEPHVAGAKPKLLTKRSEAFTVVPAGQAHAESWAEAFGQPLPLVGRAQRIARLIVASWCSAFLVGICCATSLAASGMWPVPGHKSGSFWSGFLNRLMMAALSPCFLGFFFPAFFNPALMTNWRCHAFFLRVSLVPFVVTNVPFPFLAGAGKDVSVFFSTCFWPTLMCVVFVPSMVAGIRYCRGDDHWLGLCSQVEYIRQQGRHFCLDLLCLVACWVAAVLPVNYVAVDFAVVGPNMSDMVAAVARPLISLVLKWMSVEIFKAAASHLNPAMLRYGMFPLAVNVGLHTSLSAAQCRDWLSVGIWVVCDCATIAWRTQRARLAGRIRKRCFDGRPWLSDEDLLKHLSFEAIVLGWGLTAALLSLLLLSPLAWVLPRMLKTFLFTYGLDSVKFLAVVCICDISADILSVVYLTHLCNCDFSQVFLPVRDVCTSSLSVMWAPYALGCFGWVFQHMCVATFKAEC